MRSRRTAGALLAAQVTVVGLVGACTGGHSKPPVPVPVETTAVPTTLPNYSAVALASVPGQTTLTISLTPGTARITGTVTDDTGAAVPGAIVNLVRVVGNSTASGDVPTAADGTFNAPGIIGGLYRVRAWRAPDLALTDPQVFFIGATDTKTLTLSMHRFSGQQVTASIAPNPPIIGEPAQVAVEVTTATVQPDGVVRGQGTGGVALELVGSGQWQITSSPAAVSDSSGISRWEVTCEAFGSQPLSVVVNNAETVPLNLPACAPVPTTTTAPPTTAGPTTTAVKRRGTTTTSLP